MSMKAAEVSAAALAFESVIVKVEVAPERIRPGANPSDRAGGVDTCSAAVFDPAPAIGVCAVVTPPAVLGLTPAVLLVTTTETVQLPEAGMVSPEKVSVPV